MPHDMCAAGVAAHANRHAEAGVSQRMHSIHEASHLDVSGVLLHVCDTFLTTCVQQVSPCMRPEACGLTHSRSGGVILLVEVFYKYQHPPFSLIHPSHTKIT